MRRERICTVAYFLGPYFVIRSSETGRWEAYRREGECPQVATGNDPEEVDAKLRSLTTAVAVQ